MVTVTADTMVDMADTMADITADIIPTTPTMDTVVEVTTVATMEAIILRPTTVMEGWIADIPTDMHIDPKRPLAVPRDPLPAIPGTEAAPRQQEHRLQNAPTLA